MAVAEGSSECEGSGGESGSDDVGESGGDGVRWGGNEGGAVVIAVHAGLWV